MWEAGSDKPTGPRFGGLPGLELQNSRESLLPKQAFRAKKEDQLDHFLHETISMISRLVKSTNAHKKNSPMTERCQELFVCDDDDDGDRRGQSLESNFWNQIK